MNASSYQKAVFAEIDKFVACNFGNLRVDALAGSGKSTTAKHMLTHIPAEDQVILVAFNKVIAEALKPEIGKFHANAEASTSHSFGYRLLREAVPNVRLDKYKTDSILRAEIYDTNDSKQRRLYYQSKGAIARLVSLLKADAQLEDPTADQVIVTASKYGVELPSDEERAIGNVIKVFNMSREDISRYGMIDFDDMIWGPLLLNLPIPRFPWVVVDEFQDFNCSQYLLLKAAARDGHMITFGDRHQCIYGFRGAMEGIMDTFLEELPAASSLPLSICYRCSKAVIREAQKLVPEIEASDLAPEGSIRTAKPEVLEKEVRDQDFVLCRYTAPLVSQCLKMIEQNRKAYVKGKEDIGNNLITLIGKISQAYTGYSLAESIEQYRADEAARIAKIGGPKEEDRQSELNDKLDALLAIHDGCHGVPEVNDIVTRINGIFNDDPNAKGLMFSSIHRAKGLEAKRVWILKKQQKREREVSDRQKQEEKNIEYVGITRTEEDLTYVPII